LSIVVPCLNEQETISRFYEEVTSVMSGVLSHNDTLNYEILFIDDGSKDATLELIKQHAAADSRVNYVSFSRNFGKEAALYSGMKHARGSLVAVMDADLQDPPAMLEKMLKEISKPDVDAVATRRVSRHGEPPIRSFFARRFYKLFNRLVDVDLVDGARDFRLMTRRYVDAVLELSEYNRFSKGLFAWVGFNTVWLEYENIKRVSGETKWSFFKLLAYGIDGVVAFSTKPLILTAVAGTLACVLAIIVIIFLIVRYALFGDPVAGWASTSCIIVFIGGLQLLGIGILGEYLAKTYLETKQRPLYVERESNLTDSHEPEVIS